MANKEVKLDFSKDFDFNSKNYFVVYFNEEKIIFTSYQKYEGPITMQYLPNGGIQSLFGYKIIIKVNKGFLEVDELIYKGKLYSSKSFIDLIGDLKLINQVLE